MSGLIGMLAQVLSTDEKARQSSSQLLQQEKQNNPESFVLELSRILASNSNPVASRQLAGILLKNALLNLNNEDFLANVWDSISELTKEEIRTNTLGTLAGEDRQVRLSATQAVASVARLDLSRKQWKSIIDILVTNATNINLSFKEASLMTLGYLCDGLDPTTLETKEVDSILSVIAISMTPSETNLEIKSIAFRAFKNSLKFAKKNFETPEERDYILRLIFAGCEFTEEIIRIESFRLLVDIVNLYYDFVGGFLSELGRITFQAVRQDSFKVALLALEVWNQLGDVELERREAGISEAPLRGYMNTAVNDLLILLLENIHKVQSDEDEWDVNKACASVLTVLAQLTEDRVMDLCLTYIDLNLEKPEWQSRQSSLMVIGSILEGPSNMKIAPIAKKIPLIIQLLQDEKPVVRQSASWALSKIAQYQYKLVTQPIYFNQILPALLHSLTQSPKIACHSCWTLVNLIEKSSEIRLFKLGVFEHVFTALITSAYRSDSLHPEHNLQLAAFSALSSLIEKSPDDCIGNIEQHIPNFINLFKQCASSAQSEQLHNSICEVLGACFSRARSENINEEIAKAFLETLTVAFNTRNGVFEDGILAIGSLTGPLGPRFVSFLPVVGPFIVFTLQRQDAVSLCKTGTMLIGDIARALGDSAKPFVSDLVLPLISNLRNESSSSVVKVQSIESLADVVSACKESTGPYCEDILLLIQEAAAASMTIVKEEENSDLFEYFKELREAIIEFYENLIQGFSQLPEATFGYVPGIVNYVMTISQDKYRPKPIIHRCAIGILGDLAKIYGSRLRDLLRVPAVLTYVSRYRTSNNLKIREIANWAFGLLNTI